VLSERVEALVDDDSGVGFTQAGPLDRLGDARRHRVRDRLGKRALKPGGRAEVVEQIGVGAANLCRDRLERHPLRPLLEQQLARRGKRGRATLFRAEACSSY